MSLFSKIFLQKAFDEAVLLLIKIPNIKFYKMFYFSVL